MAEPRSRRGHGEDSIYFDQVNNHWVGAVSHGYEAGKRVRKTVTGRTKTAVKAKLRQLRQELDNGVRSSATYTVGNALDDWLIGGLSGRSDRTRELYRDTVKPLREPLGDIKLRELNAGDVQQTLDALAEAFEDNQAPAAPVGVDGTELSLIVLVPGEDAVPERLPNTTQAGNLTLRKLAKGERSALYLLLIAGHVLVTLREAFAVAPGVDAARVIAVRRSGPDIYGRAVLDCMVAGRWTRTAFNSVRWADADAGHILAGTATELVLNQKRGQILPVDLSTEPEIRDLLSTMDTTDPATED